MTMTATRAATASRLSESTANASWFRTLVVLPMSDSSPKTSRASGCSAIACVTAPMLRMIERFHNPGDLMRSRRAAAASAAPSS